MALQRVQNSAACLIFELNTREHVTPCLLQLMAFSTLARPVQRLLCDALCLLRDVSSVSDKHCRVHWCLPDIFCPSVDIINGLQTATAVQNAR